MLPEENKLVLIIDADKSVVDGIVARVGVDRSTIYTLTDGSYAVGFFVDTIEALTKAQRGEILTIEEALATGLWPQAPEPA